MANDQQFCLRWNNHQSTLISVFDSLLENETLVDCTLAAEGQSLKAHKVVLSACSPYLESLLSKHYEKHPILILKDVKFTELKSMMDYMYRGEVNICQDQLGTFLKAAESLQIKGLSDNGDEAVGTSSAAPKKDPPRPSVTQTTRTPVESKRPAPPGDSSDASRDGSISPSSLRKRRRTRRPSQGDEVNHLDSNCDTAQTAPIVPAVTVPAPVKQIVKQEPNLSINETGLKKEIIEPPNEPLLEPKTEYLDYMNNENSIEVEDLTLDDDDDLDSSMDASRPGPSHGDMSNQGYPAWPMGDQSGTDEIFMAAQEAVGAATGQQQRDSQGAEETEAYECLNCSHSFISQESLVAHLRQVTQGREVTEHCFLCDHSTDTFEDMSEHLQLLHPEHDLSTTYVCEGCKAKFLSEREVDCHTRTCKMNLDFDEELTRHMLTRTSENLKYCYTVQITDVKSLVEGKKVLLVGNTLKAAPKIIVGNTSKATPKRERPKRIPKVVTISKSFKNTINSEDEDQETSSAVQSITEETEQSTQPESDMDDLQKLYHFFNSGDLDEIRKGYKCPHCDKTFTSYAGAKVHLQTVCLRAKSKKQCHKCDYQTRQASNLKRHYKLVHAAPDAYICERCGKEFKKRLNFSHHTKYNCGTVHPLDCPLCDYSTKIPGLLNTHLLKVHNQAVKKAVERKRRKSLFDDFPEPIKVPEGYQCPDCMIVVRLPEGYRKHRRRVHPEEEVTMNCLVNWCNYTTNNNHNLKQHLKRVHFLVSRVRGEQLELLEELDDENEDSKD